MKYFSVAVFIIVLVVMLFVEIISANSIKSIKPSLENDRIDTVKKQVNVRTNELSRRVIRPVLE